MRRDPSTRIVHYGKVIFGGTFRDDRMWVPHCRGGSSTDTVWWSVCLEPEGPTCLWCIAKEFT